MRSVELAYRKSASASVSGLGLLIALYDILADDLRCAADADRRNNIEERCRKAKHALLVIGHLEHWVQNGSGGELAERLKVFYVSLRRKILQAQAKRSPALLEEQMALVLEFRAQWQKMEAQSTSAAPHVLPPVVRQRQSGPFSSEPERRHLSWSA